MPRRNGTRSEYRPISVTHDCIWPGCITRIQTSKLACPADWVKIPTHLRNAWNDARQSGSTEAVDLARSAIRAYAERNPEGRNT